MEANNRRSITAFEGHSSMSSWATQKAYKMREQLLSCIHTESKPINGNCVCKYSIQKICTALAQKEPFILFPIQARCGQSFNTSAKFCRLPTARQRRVEELANEKKLNAYWVSKKRILSVP